MNVFRMGIRLLTLCACLLVSSAAAEEKRRLLLLGQGPDGHKPTTHEYRAGVRVLMRCLASVPNLSIKTDSADGEWSRGPELLKNADGVVMFLSDGAKWLQQDPRRQEAFARLAQRGGGLAVLHWGMGTREAKNIAGFVRLFGACHGGPDRKFKVVETTLVTATPRHPALTGVADVKVRDEFYYRLKRVKSATPLTPLLTARIDKRQEMVAWAWKRPDGGRSFGFSGLHFHKHWEREEYRRLVAQAILWTLKLPIPAGGISVKVSAKDLTLP